MSRNPKVLIFMCIVLLVGAFILALEVQMIHADGAIYIRLDGSIEPLTANITSVDTTTYRFTDNNCGELVIEKDNIIVDGAGYNLEGSWSSTSRGVNITEGTGVTIKNMGIKKFYYGVWIKASSRIMIMECAMSYGTTGTNGRGVQVDTSSNVTILGNNMTNASYCVNVNDSKNITISRNVLVDNDFGIDMYNSSGCCISDNDITSCIDDGINLHACSNNIISNNIIIDCGGYRWFGIRLFSSSNNALINNTLIDNGYGISTSRSYNITVRLNTVICNGYGVSLGSGNSTVYGNTFFNNSRGIYVYQSSFNNISDNNITKSRMYGVYFLRSSKNLIVGNEIKDNNAGIFLDNSSENLIHHNSFANNTVHVLRYNSQSINAWDNGYPSGGNYWSNHSDVDLFRGPSQNISGSDGIWDHPHVLDENNQDNYPLVPEFHSFILLSLLITATLLAALIFKRKLVAACMHEGRFSRELGKMMVEEA